MLLKAIILVLVVVSVSFCTAKTEKGTGTGTGTGTGECTETTRDTEYGSVCGKILTSRANSTIEYLAFKGIPYAAPPIGYLRFQEPQPPEPWITTKCAKKFRSVCMQWEPATASNVIGSEDCLYLSVFIPITAANSSQMPVIVRFHGGHWITGTFTDAGPDYFMEEPVVIVAVEFRLNVFGFFTTLDNSAKGNLGLKDQVLALQWVQTNIENFNGDPSRVTLLGAGSGGISVIYHMLSPLSRGLFSGAISQTASPLSGDALVRNPMERTEALLRALDIDTTDTEEQVAQLQAIDAETLVRTALNYSVVGYYTPCDGQPFGPIIERESDTSFLSDSTYDLLENGNYSRVPLIIGFNSQPAEYCWSFIQSGDVDISLYQTDPATRLLPEGMNIPEDDPCATTTLNNITERYFPDDNYTNPNELIPYLSFVAWDMGILKTVYYFQRQLTVYFYYFSYLGSRNSVYLRPPGTRLFEDSLYLWYPLYSGSNPNETDADRLTRRRMVTMWTNFAYNRNPTPRADPLFQNVRWPALTRTRQNYLNINSTLTIGSPLPRQSEMPFWLDLYEACGFPDPNPNDEP